MKGNSKRRHQEVDSVIDRGYKNPLSNCLVKAKVVARKKKKKKSKEERKEEEKWKKKEGDIE